MAPQTDKPVPPKAGDHTPAKADTATDALQRQANDLRHEAPKPTDASKPKPVEVDTAKVVERLKLSIKPEDLNIVAREHDIKETRRQLIDELHKPGTDARTLQATQDTFKKQVNDAIAVSTNLSAGAAGDRPIDRINSSMSATERHQADLEKTLKVTPANQETILKGLLSKNSAALSPTEKDYVETLSMKETLKRAKESASVTNAVYGSAVAQGLIGDLSHRDANGMATPSNAEVADAFTKMGTAQRLNGEARESGGFKDDYTKIVSKYADQLTATGRSTLSAINTASGEWHSNPAGAESLLRSANYTVDSLNLQQIQQQLDANKNNPDLTEKLSNVLKVANSARLEYASFLYENGRVGEAKTRLDQANRETPAQSAADPSYQQLREKTDAKANADLNSTGNWQTTFTESLQKRDWDKADVAAKHIQDETNARMKQTDAGKAALDQQQTQLQEKLSQAKTQAEKDSLTQQMTALKSQSADLDGRKKMDTTNLAYLSYQQGFLHMSEKKMAEAHEDFAKVAALDPELAKRLNDNPPGGIPKLDDLVKESKEPTWWQSHWRMVAGVGIGIAATAAVIATGGAALPAVAIVLGGGALYAGAGATAGETEGKQLAINFGVGCATTAVSVVLKGAPTWLGWGGAATESTVAGVAGGEVANVGLNAVASEGITETAKLTATELTKASLTGVAEETGKAGVTEFTKSMVANTTATEGLKVVASTEATNAAATQATSWGARALANVQAFPGAALETGKQVFSLNTAKEFIAVPTLKQASTQIGVATTGLGLYEGVYNMGVKGETASEVYSHLGKDALAAALLTRGAATIGTVAPGLSFLNSGIMNSGMGIPTTALGYSFAAVPQAQSYYKGNQSFDQAVKGTLTDGAVTSMTFGLTSHTLDKYLTPDKIFTATGSLDAAAMAKGMAWSTSPYVIQEGLGSGINFATGANKPLDPTNAADARAITADYAGRNQYDVKLPQSAPERILDSQAPAGQKANGTPDLQTLDLSPMPDDK